MVERLRPIVPGQACRLLRHVFVQGSQSDR